MSGATSDRPGAADAAPGRSPLSLTARRVPAAAALVARAAPGALALYVALTLVTGALPVAVAWITKLIIDQLVTRGESRQLVVLALGLALTGVVAAAMPHVAQYLRLEIDRTVGLLAQDRLFNAVDGFVGLGRFEDPHFLDRLRLAQQPGGIPPHSSQALDGVLGIGRVAFTITGFLGSLFLLSPIMAAVVLLAGIPTVAAQLALSRRRARMLWEIGPAERREFFYTGLLSTVEAAKEVRLFGLGAFFRHRMLDNRRIANTAKRAIDRRQAMVQVFLGLLAAAVSGAGLLWAISSARQGRLQVGDVTIFVAAVAGVQGALSTLAADIARTHQALLMFDHYLAVTTAGPELPVTASPRRLPPTLQHGIEFRDVWFRYSDDHPWVLRGVNLNLRRGESLALVGRNGAGKSTLVKLLCRFYDPTRGAILWDGVDIRDVDVAELRSRFSAAFQDYMEYDLTAGENIGIGDLDVFTDHERIRAAAERAGVHEKLAALPRGYDTLLSRVYFTEIDKDNPETGVVLSGGQWQRIALARAFFRAHRDLLILDEPSAGLDPEAEYQIHTSLIQHRQGQTSLLISHRLGAVRDADQIVVLSEGRVVEYGDHHSLLDSGGEYARLFTMQASGYQLEQPDPGDPTALTGSAR